MLRQSITAALFFAPSAAVALAPEPTRRPVRSRPTIRSAPAVAIDGRVDTAEWAGARRLTDFRVAAPYTLATPPLRTEVRLRSTLLGIAVAFRRE